MEEISRKISVRAEGTNTVLVIELQEGEQLVPYCCKMMENNTIPGLLSMKHQSMDGVVSLRYNIGGKITLREFVSRGSLPYERGILLLRNLSLALLHLHEYFLSADMCCLDPEHIYVGDGLCVYLPCIPVQREQEKSTSVRLKVFYEKLLSEYFATADCSTYDSMFKWVYRTTLFDLETFYRKFLKEGEEKQAPQSPAQPSASVRPSVPAQPSASVRPSAPAQPSASVRPSVPAQPSASVRPSVPAQPSASVRPSVPAQPSASVRPSVPAQPSAPVSVQRQAAAPQASVRAGLQQEESAGSPGGRSFAVPGGMSIPIPEEKGGGKTKKEKKSFLFFSSRGEKADVAPEAAVPPASLHPAPSPLRSAAAPLQPGSAQPLQGMGVPPSPAQEAWDDGTILVGSPSPVPASASAPGPQAVKSAVPYFIHRGKRVDITQTPFVVGKYNTTCTLHYALFDNNRISRSHATFLCMQGKYYIRDNQSRNGTSLNGKSLVPLQPVELKDGDEIRLYDESLEFHLAGNV